jgi:hypothetical protein
MNHFLLIFLLALPCLAQSVTNKDWYRKVYDFSNGTHAEVGHNAPIHYKDSTGAFRDQDFTLVRQDSGWTVQKANYKIYFPPHSNGTATFRDRMFAKNQLLKFTPVVKDVMGRLIPDSAGLVAANLYDQLKNNCIIYDNIRPGMDLIYAIYNTHSISKIIRYRKGFYPANDTVLRFGVTIADSTYQAASAAVLANAVQKQSAKVNLANAVQSIIPGNPIFIGRGTNVQSFTAILPAHIWENKPIFGRDSAITMSITNIGE